MFRLYGYDQETKSFRHFPYNENPTRALNTSYLQAGKKFTHVYEGSRSPHPPGFGKKKVGYFSNREVQICKYELKYSGYALIANISRNVAHYVKSS